MALVAVPKGPGGRGLPWVVKDRGLAVVIILVALDHATRAVGDHHDVVLVVAAVVVVDQGRVVAAGVAGRDRRHHAAHGQDLVEVLAVDVGGGIAHRRAV
jgi:hypothetical protein